MHDSIKFADWQGLELKNGVLAVLAGARIAYEDARRSKTARAAGALVLAALVITLWTLVTFRVAQAQQERKFEAWQARFAEDYISQREAEERGMPVDPRVELQKQETTAFARLMSGLKLYDYSTDDYRTLAQGIACRVASPDYPDTIVEVIEQPRQWPGYSADNEVTEKDYQTAALILAEIGSAEHPAVSNSFVYASFEREGITLRDTWEISTRTHFWRAGE